MLQKTASILRERCLLEPPALIVVGVSGGPDSLCLMHVLHVLGYRLIVAHLDHQLRPESANEAAAVTSAATALGISCRQERVDVGARARSGRLSIEDAAREARYKFLFSEARRISAQAVAVGHTADDQAETVLMHLIRGAGMAGLKAMSYRSVLPHFDAGIPLVRPLLGTWRWETVDYCRLNALLPQHDRSNDSIEYFRNRVRHELMPLLETYNPRIRESLWRAAETLASDLALVDEHVAQAWHQSVFCQTDHCVTFDLAQFSRRSLPLRRRLVLMAARRLLPAMETSYSTLERAAALVSERAPSRLDLGGGLEMRREAAAIHISLGGQSPPIEVWPQMQSEPMPLPSQSPVKVPLLNDWKFTAEYVDAGESPMASIGNAADAFHACLDADTLPAPLELRPPRPGDRFRPLGLQGHSQKLSDVFINAKVPQRARAHWPLLCSGRTLIWVPGFRPAEAFKLTRETRRAAWFAVSRLE